MNSLPTLLPVLCPPGMHLKRTTKSISDPRGNATGSNLVCTDGNEEVDATGKMLGLLFGVAILGAVLLGTWTLTGPSEEADTPELILKS